MICFSTGSTHSVTSETLFIFSSMPARFLFLRALAGALLSHGGTLRRVSFRNAFLG